MSSESKACLKCKEVKPVRHFYYDGRYKDWMYPYCKSCKSEMVGKTAQTKRDLAKAA